MKKVTCHIATKDTYIPVEGYIDDMYKNMFIYCVQGKSWTVTDAPTGYRIDGGYRTRRDAQAALPGLHEKLNQHFMQNPDFYNKLVKKKDDWYAEHMERQNPWAAGRDYE